MASVVTVPTDDATSAAIRGRPRVVLPLLCATGVPLLRGDPAGPALAAVLLTFKVVLGLALLSMSFAFLAEPQWGEVGLWAVIIVVSAGWITAGLRRMRPAGRHWLRPRSWPATGQSARPRP